METPVERLAERGSGGPGELPAPPATSQFKTVMLVLVLASLGLLGAAGACPYILWRASRPTPDDVGLHFAVDHAVTNQRIRGGPYGMIIYTSPRFSSVEETRRTYRVNLSGPAGAGLVQVDLELRDGEWVVVGGSLTASDETTYPMLPPPGTGMAQ